MLDVSERQGDIERVYCVAHRYDQPRNGGWLELESNASYVYANRRSKHGKDQHYLTRQDAGEGT
jgi:hypothetical protein